MVECEEGVEVAVDLGQAVGYPPVNCGAWTVEERKVYVGSAVHQDQIVIGEGGGSNGH